MFLPCCFIGYTNKSLCALICAKVGIRYNTVDEGSKTTHANSKKLVCFIAHHALGWQRRHQDTYVAAKKNGTEPLKVRVAASDTRDSRLLRRDKVFHWRTGVIPGARGLLRVAHEDTKRLGHDLGDPRIMLRPKGIVLHG
jgi:hypothetical protein